MEKPRFRVVLRRAARQSWRIVIAHTWQAWALKLVSTALLLMLAYTYTQYTTARDEDLFADTATLVGLTFSAATILVFGVFLAQLLFVAPFQLWKGEWERAEKVGAELAQAKASGPELIRDRTSLTNALMYACFLEWDRSPHDLGDEDAIAFLGSKVREFRQLAHEGLLTVWGQRSLAGQGVHEKINPDLWTEQGINWFSIIEGKPRTERESTGPHNIYGEYSNLLVRRSEVERIFPKDRDV